MSSIAEKIGALSGQLPDTVQLVAVSKTKPITMIEEAYAAGQRVFGENRPLELREKAEELPEDIQWHMIGSLQSNKVKYIIDKVALIHSLDRIELMEVIERRAAMINRTIDCLLQVHIAQEQSKSGFRPEELMTLLEEQVLERFPHICVQGLMGMATFTDDQEQVRSEFAALAQLKEQIIARFGKEVLGQGNLSMGMSGDYELAIEEGSSMVRVGSKIFGAR